MHGEGLEQDLVFERIKEGLRARRKQGIVLAKPKAWCSPPGSTMTARAFCTCTCWACRYLPSWMCT